MCIHVHVELHVYSGEECRERERLGVKFINCRFEIMSYDALCLRPSERGYKCVQLLQYMYNPVFISSLLHAVIDYIRECLNCDIYSFLLPIKKYHSFIHSASCLLVTVLLLLLLCTAPLLF